MGQVVGPGVQSDVCSWDWRQLTALVAGIPAWERGQTSKSTLTLAEVCWVISPGLGFPLSNVWMVNSTQLVELLCDLNFDLICTKPMACTWCLAHSPFSILVKTRFTLVKIAC